MNTTGYLREVENLRFRVQMNNRLRLECLAAVSKVFREFEEPINDELLSSMIFALPQELISGNGHSKTKVEAKSYQSAEKGIPPQKPGIPPQSPTPEPEKPGLPPQEPEQAPAIPPQSPADAPAIPPQSPE